MTASVAEGYSTMHHRDAGTTMASLVRTFITSSVNDGR